MMVLGLKPSYYHVFTTMVFIECLKCNDFCTRAEFIAYKIVMPPSEVSGGGSKANIEANK